MSSRDTVLEHHLYRITCTDADDADCSASYWDMASPVWGEPERLTAAGASHSVYLNPALSSFVDAYSSATTSPECCIMDIPAAGDFPAGHRAAGKPFFTHASLSFYVAPDPFSFVSVDGHTVHGTVHRPPESVYGPGPHPTIMYGYLRPTFARASSKNRLVCFTLCDCYPQHARAHTLECGLHVLRTDRSLHLPARRTQSRHGVGGLNECFFAGCRYVYGGPHVQLCTNENKAVRQMRMSMLARLGYTIVMLDGRGSNRRGLRWESHLKHRMGQVRGARPVCPVDIAELCRCRVFWTEGTSLLELNQSFTYRPLIAVG